MNTTVKIPRTAAAIEARRQNTQAMVGRVQDTITLLCRQKAAITYSAVARRATVSRTFLYENPDARALVTDAIARTSDRREGSHSEYDTQQDASWRERARNAEEALKTAYAEIRSQRDRMAQLMGQIRDLEQQWSQEDIQRFAAENSALKQRVRQITQDNRTLEERLTAARDNGRFADRRISQLEAQLLEAVHLQT